MRVMRSVRHLTPRYVVNRTRVFLDQKRHPDWPWLAASIVPLIEDRLKASDTGIEWGSGRSTVWFASRVRSMTTVEHDAGWAHKVGSMLREKNRNNVTMVVATGPEEYVNAATEIPASSLDFALVDGMWWERDKCAHRAIALLRPGGMLIVDNVHAFLPGQTYAPGAMTSDTPLWREFEAKVRNWACVRKSNGVWDTAFWIRS